MTTPQPCSSSSFVLLLVLTLAAYMANGRTIGAGDTLRIGQTEFIVQYNEVGEARSGEET